MEMKVSGYGAELRDVLGENLQGDTAFRVYAFHGRPRLVVGGVVQDHVELLISRAHISLDWESRETSAQVFIRKVASRERQSSTSRPAKSTVQYDQPH